MTWDADRLAAELAEVPDVGSAARLVVARLREQGDLLPSVYLSQGDRLRCLAIEGYWQTFDGIPAGAGVIGRAFDSGKRTMVRDVTTIEHYLPAAPDVVDELSVPLLVSGTVVGVLNVESQSRLTAAAEQRIDEAAALLARRLHELPLPAESAAQKIGRHAAVLDRLATQGPSTSDREALHDAVLHAATDISGLETAVLCVQNGGGPQIVAATGPLAGAFLELPGPTLEGIGSFVDAGTSAYTVSSGAGLRSPLHTHLREAGAQSLLVLPLGSGTQRLGLLLVASTAVLPFTTDDAQLLELLAAEVVSCLRLSDSMRELRERADRDALTGLGHHAAFHARLPTVRATATPSAERLAVLYIDVDHFKQVNDSQGHAAGDRLLTAITTCMTDALRSSDRLFRIGGDEFAALVEVTGEQHALALAQRLLERVVAVSGATLSIGVAVATGSESDAALLARADAALYDAKAAGRCTVRLHRASRSA